MSSLKNPWLVTDFKRGKILIYKLSRKLNCCIFWGIHSIRNCKQFMGVFTASNLGLQSTISSALYSLSL
jgi:hypothetical protein